MKFLWYLCCITSLFAAEGRVVPSRFIPVPLTASPQIQNSILTLPEQREKILSIVPKNMEEWDRIIREHQRMGADRIVQIRKYFPVKGIEQKSIAGVNVYEITPQIIPEQNQNRILIAVHGGAFVFMGGEAGTVEAILGAFYTKMRVIAVDYRMPPYASFPAGIDDVVSVYKELIKTNHPSNIGFLGTSSGGNIIAAAILKLRDQGLPLPGAAALGSPVCDLRPEGGDTRMTNQYIDVYLPTSEGLLTACVKLYAGAHEVTDPLLSPIFGDMTAGFPPTIFTSGTRDLLLSDTVRMYTKLRQANIDAKLQVFEALSHGQHVLTMDAPESKQAFIEIGRFFDQYLRPR